MTTACATRCRGLRLGLPSKDAISRVAESIDPGEIRKILTYFAPELLRRHFESRRGARKANMDLINLAAYGKTSVGATLRGMSKSETHIVSAARGPVTVGMEPVR